MWPILLYPLSALGMGFLPLTLLFVVLRRRFTGKTDPDDSFISFFLCSGFLGAIALVVIGVQLLMNGPATAAIWFFGWVGWSWVSMRSLWIIDYWPIRTEK